MGRGGRREGRERKCVCVCVSVRERRKDFWRGTFSERGREAVSIMRGREREAGERRGWFLAQM